MKDFLKDYCKDQNIKLKYTKNKSTVLSIDIQKNTTTIRIHRMFKECPEDIANKIIQYYKFYLKNYNIIKALQDYIENYYSKPESTIYGINEFPLKTFARNSLQVKQIENLSKPYTYKSSEKTKSKNKNNEEHEYTGAFSYGDSEIYPNNVYIHNEKAINELKKVDVTLNEDKGSIFTLQPDKRSIIHGTVKLPDGRIAKDALVKLLIKKDDPCILIPITYTFTDENGEFMFKVNPGVFYIVKIFYYD